jgi:FKBP-type peptidyl-prolyl cis-trans isomerase 2
VLTILNKKTNLIKKIYFMEKVMNESTVTVHYTGRLEDGTVFDSSLVEGRDPLTATLGQGNLIPGFESGLVDMTVGEKKTIEIEPENAYGQINPQMVNEVAKGQVPEGVSVGDMLQAMSPAGPINVKVLEINEDVVVLDANHPLAGQKLIFDLEVVSIS